MRSAHSPFTAEDCIFPAFTLPESAFRRASDAMILALLKCRQGQILLNWSCFRSHAIQIAAPFSKSCVRAPQYVQGSIWLENIR